MLLWLQCVTGCCSHNTTKWSVLTSNTNRSVGIPALRSNDFHFRSVSRHKIRTSNLQCSWLCLSFLLTLLNKSSFCSSSKQLPLVLGVIKYYWPHIYGGRRVSAAVRFWSSSPSSHGISGSVCLQLKTSADVTSVQGCLSATLSVLSRPYDAIVCALQALVC
jgi:hypothetical protein